MNLEQRIINTMAATFAVEASSLSTATRQHELPAWDSLGQLRLIMQLESEFGVSFSIDEIPELNSVERIATRLRAILKE